MSYKKGYVDISNPLIKALVKFKIVMILSNWTFQGMLYADKTERLFRLLLDGLMTLVLYVILINFISSSHAALIFAFLIAHTLNWIFNGQLFVLAKNFDILYNEPQRFIDYANGIKIRASRDKSIDCVVVYGSLVRGEIKTTSDLDVRIIRKSGIINGFRASVFGLMERSRALFNRFPLDIFVVDSTDHLLKMNDDEKPQILYDQNGILRKQILE